MNGAWLALLKNKQKHCHCWTRGGEGGGEGGGGETAIIFSTDGDTPYKKKPWFYSLLLLPLRGVGDTPRRHRLDCSLDRVIPSAV